jgi:hypothetical protein
MTTLPLQLRGRMASDVSWDGARERRVLALALAARRRHARRKWMLELTAAMAVTWVAGRFLPRAFEEGGETRPALAAPGRELDTTPGGRANLPRSESAAKPSKSPPMGGFAGTGGHGGTDGAGHGGRAGTG